MERKNPLAMNDRSEPDLFWKNVVFQRSKLLPMSGSTRAKK
jgi:hypothetical protein